MRAITVQSRISQKVSIDFTKYYPENSLRSFLEKKYKNLMFENLNLRTLVSFVGNKNFPILRIFKYKEAFSLQLVEFLFSKLSVNSNDYVIDPFVGLGTTTFTSMLNNIHSVGLDKLPLAYFIAKTLPLFPFLKGNELKTIWQQLKTNIDREKPAQIALDVPIINSAFDKQTLLLLRKLKTSIEKLEEPYRNLFLFLFLSIIEECSYTSKDGQFLRIRKDKKVSDPITAIENKIFQIEEDIKKLKNLYPEISQEYLPKIYLADARESSSINLEKKPTVLITSPPYVNRYDYTRSYCLELCFGFVKNFEELKDLRFSILRSHIESKIKENEHPNHPAINEIVGILMKKKLNNPRIPIMIISYFIDMEKVIKEWYKILKPGSRIAIVINNVRFEGELLPVDLILCDIAEKIGFKINEILIARYKGNSAQQMKKYGKVPLRESIIIWEK